MAKQTENKKLDSYERYVQKCKEKGKKPMSRYEYEQKKGKIALALGAGGTLVGGKKIKSMVTGREKVYHGTRNARPEEKPAGLFDNGIKMKYEDRVSSIEKNGLRKDYGGQNVAKLDAIYAKNGKQDKAFVDADKTSQGTIHVSKSKKYADHYGDKITNAFGGKMSPKQSAKFMRNNMGWDAPEGAKLGKTFEIDMPYDDFKKMKPDEKVVKLAAKQLHVNDKVAEKFNKHTSKAYQGPVDVDPAAIKGNKEVSKEDRKKYNKEQFARYAKNHKGRLAAGALGATALTGAAAYGAYKIIKNERDAKKAYEKYKNKGGKLSYNQFKKQVYMEFYNYAFDNYQTLIESGFVFDEADYEVLNALV